MAKHKRAAADRSPRSVLESAADRKLPRAQPADPKARGPLWAFRIADLGGPWCWAQMDRPVQREVLERLRRLETMTWREIDGPTGSHAVEVGRLAKPARDRLIAIQQDDVEQLFSLRITGERRVWGILEEHVLKILWWDPHHQVCPAPKKHT